MDRKGISLSTFFKEVNPKAIAAASIGQVHKTRSHENQQLLTKFQYPGIAKSMKSDLWLLKIVLNTLQLLMVK